MIADDFNFIAARARELALKGVRDGTGIEVDGKWMPVEGEAIAVYRHDVPEDTR